MRSIAARVRMNERGQQRHEAGCFADVVVVARMVLFVYGDANSDSFVSGVECTVLNVEIVEEMNLKNPTCR